MHIPLCSKLTVEKQSVCVLNHFPFQNQGSIMQILVYGHLETGTDESNIPFCMLSPLLLIRRDQKFTNELRWIESDCPVSYLLWRAWFLGSRGCRWVSKKAWVLPQLETPWGGDEMAWAHSEVTSCPSVPGPEGLHGHFSAKTRMVLGKSRWCVILTHMPKY